MIDCAWSGGNPGARRGGAAGRACALFAQSGLASVRPTGGFQPRNAMYDRLISKDRRTAGRRPGDEPSTGRARDAWTSKLTKGKALRLPPMIHGPKARIKQKRMSSAHAPMAQPKIHSKVLIGEQK